MIAIHELSTISVEESQFSKAEFCLLMMAIRSKDFLGGGATTSCLLALTTSVKP
jgi:hypothetical protein